MKKLSVSKRVLTLLGAEGLTISECDGEMYDREERHMLHMLLGKLGEKLLPYAVIPKASKTINQKMLQAYISDRNVDPLIRLGLLEYVDVPDKAFDLHLIVDERGSLLRVEMSNNDGSKKFQTTLDRNMSVQDFVYHCIGKFYSK